MSTLALWTMEKTVTLGGERRHLHKGALIAPTFSAPPLVQHLRRALPRAGRTLADQR